MFEAAKISEEQKQISQILTFVTLALIYADHTVSATVVCMCATFVKFGT